MILLPRRPRARCEPRPAHGSCARGVPERPLGRGAPGPERPRVDPARAAPAQGLGVRGARGSELRSERPAHTIRKNAADISAHP